MKEFIHHLTERNYQNRTVAMMENGSWAPQAVKIMEKMLSESNNLTFVEPKVRIMGALNDASREQISNLAQALCK